MNTLPQRKLVNSSTSLLGRLNCGTTLEKYLVSERKEDIEDSSFPTSTNLCLHRTLINRKSVIVESPRPHKKKIWLDRLPSSEIDTLITQSSKILDQALTLKEKVLTPFWTVQSKGISRKLWLPTETDCVDSVLSSWNESFKPVMGRSWFSIKKRRPQKKSSLTTSFRSSQFSLPDCMDSEAINSKDKSGKPLKTLKIRLFPTKEQKQLMNETMNQYRWYYNACLTILYLEFLRREKRLDNEFKLSEITVRDEIIGKYRYTEEMKGRFLIQDYVYDENNSVRLGPDWIPKKGTTRTQRGAIEKLVSNVNSALSNKRNGNISKFQLKHMSKKFPTEYVHYEDKGFPALFRNIKSSYWYTDKNRKRTTLSFQQIFNNTKKKGIEVIHEKETDKYFLHYPVEVNWFPQGDRRSDNQASYLSDEENRVISLDPGVRKFMVGYDPKGGIIFFGDGASKDLTSLLLLIDQTADEKKTKFVLWKKVKDMVNELHWKTINFLIKNYDTILLPDFRISQMVRKKNISRLTKRLLYMFSFFSFKLKLKYKCDTYGKKLIIVDESYTSKTCGKCGRLNNVQGSEVYVCSCGLNIDRDVNGSRNILIKNITLR